LKYEFVIISIYSISPYLLPQITNLHLVAGTRTFKRGSSGFTACSEDEKARLYKGNPYPYTTDYPMAPEKFFLNFFSSLTLT
jgi:hypothetical protein